MIARVFHALASPAFAAAEWSSSPFWGRYADVPFDVAVVVAQAAVDSLRRADVAAAADH